MHELSAPEGVDKPAPAHASGACAYGYCRASTGRQQITNQAQEEQILPYYEYKLKSRGVAWGGCFHDPDATSRLPWGERPGGRRLMERLRPGDHVLVAKHDRPFRSVAEAAETIQRLQASQITLHILNLNVDLSDHYGRFFFHILMAFAELEREMIGERTSAALQWKKKRGLPYGCGVPFGWRKIGKGRDSRFAPCPHSRELCYLILELRAKGLDWWRIPGELRKRGHRNSRGNEISISRCFAFGKAARAGFPLPNGARRHCFRWEPALWRSWGIDYREGQPSDLESEPADGA